jgi:hypothetical protein
MRDAPGILPLNVWRQFFPDGVPDLRHLVLRYEELMECVQRCRLEGYEPLREWLVELGTVFV